MLPLRLSGIALAVLLAASPAHARSLRDYLSPEAVRTIAGSARSPEVSRALDQLDRCGLPRPLLEQLVASRKAAPFLVDALPRLAELSHLRGMPDLVRRFSSNGQGAAYELAVAHAHRQNICAVSSFCDGEEVDGQLLSGTVLESKSAPPKRPDHLLIQLRRRAAGGRRVALALGYLPSPSQLQELIALSRELGGRVEVQQIPLRGMSYQVLVPGNAVEDPTNRLPAPGTMAAGSPAPAARRPFARPGLEGSRGRFAERVRAVQPPSPRPPQRHRLLFR